jgi:hypothetical protein
MMTKKVAPRIRVDLRSGGGTYHEYFERTTGWQDRIRAWVKRLDVGAGKEAIMYYAANGVTFNYVKTLVTE